MEINERTGEKKYCNLQFPVRCKSCSRDWKRYQRMRRRLNAIWAASWDFFGCDYTVVDEEGVVDCDEKCPCDKCRIYSRPKLITFALPSQNSEDYEDRYNQIKLLAKKMKKALKILRTNGVLGGTFVIECTSRLTELSEGFLHWKHHAHVHMVALAPKVPFAALPEFSKQLLPIGLGRINYIAPTKRKEVAGYISKYITKDTVHSRTWGVMRGFPKERI